MTRFLVTSCSIDDGPSIAKVVVSAFWTDPTWKVIWPGKTLEFVTSQSARRMPHTLLLNRTNRCHQKVIDSDTNAVVGYARWTFPQIEGSSFESIWTAAQVPSVARDRESEAEAEYVAADYAFDCSLDELDEPLDAIMARLMSQQRYIVLDVLAVYPEYWRKGIGTMLVQRGMGEIERLGLKLDILVRAKKAALTLYQKAGFVLVDQLVLDASRFGVKEEYGAYFLVKSAEG